MRKFSVGVAAFALLVILAGCARNGASSQVSPTSGTSIPSPEPTELPNEIQQVAADAYRAALLKSQSEAAASGLTELWFDIDGELVEVSVQAESGAVFVTQDILDGAVYEVDQSAMMPAMQLAELDALAVSGTDYGSVIYNDQNQVEVSNNIDGIIYVTTYVIGKDGLINRAVIVADDEPLGEVTYTYRVTKEGKAALTALKATS